MDWMSARRPAAARCCRVSRTALRDVLLGRLQREAEVAQLQLLPGRQLHDQMSRRGFQQLRVEADRRLAALRRIRMVDLEDLRLLADLQLAQALHLGVGDGGADAGGDQQGQEAGMQARAQAHDEPLDEGAAP
jgi:hypothetical protein